MRLLYSMNLITKLLMNSLYGRFAKIPINSKTIFVGKVEFKK